MEMRRTDSENKKLKETEIDKFVYPNALSGFPKAEGPIFPAFRVPCSDLS